MTCRSAQAESVRVAQSSLDRAMRQGAELRSKVEAAIGRYKRVIGDALRSLIALTSKLETTRALIDEAS